MRVRHFSGRFAVIGLVATLGTTIGFEAACARIRTPDNMLHFADRNAVNSPRRLRLASYGHISGVLQCVPFARANSGIEIIGNANTWWNNAEGVYQRGSKPEVGSVLNFRANGIMRLGHVAVVSSVIDSRNIEIDHANWSDPGSISRNINVVDVSPLNDWTAVRVALGRSTEFGSVYPTYGFIYDRPDAGMMVANNAPAPAPVLNPPPRDLRPVGERYEAAATQEPEEVAEASDEAGLHYRRGPGQSKYAGRVSAALAANLRAQGRDVGLTRVDNHRTPPARTQSSYKHRT